MTALEAHNQDPAAQRHKLRLALRNLRSDAGLTQRQVAQGLDWSEAKLRRIESGQVGISTTDLRALLQHYNVTEPTVTHSMIEMAVAGRRQLWGEYRHVLSAAYLVYLRYEAIASAVRAFQPTVIPGVLQTEEYAWHLIQRRASPDTPQETLLRQLQARTDRQEAVFGRDEVPRLSFVIGETALRRPVSPQPDGTKIMQRQIERLVEVAAHPAVQIQILPLSEPMPQGVYESPFVLLDFPESGDGIVYLEQPRNRSAISDDLNEINKCEESFRRLTQTATDPNALASFLHDLAP